MKLERKIIFSFAFLSVLLVGVGLVWEFYYTQLNNEQLAENREANEIVDHTNSMEIDLYQTLIYLNLIHETKTSEETDIDIRNIPLKAKTIEGFNTNFEKFFLSLEELETLIQEKPELIKEVDELKKKAVLYESISRDWLQMEDAQERSHIIFLSSIAPYFLNNIVPNFEEIRELIAVTQNSTISKLNEQIMRGRVFNYLVTGVILIFGIVIGIYLYRSIIKPLDELTASLNKIGSGDLGYRTELTSEDEFGYVGNAINSMAENLEEKTISSSYLDNVMESISEGIFVVDDSGIVKRLNDAGADLLEMQKEDIKGECIYDFVNLIESEEELNGRNKEYQLETLKSSKLPVLFSESDLMENGDRIGRVLVVRDISELKSAENELRKSLDEKDVMLAEIHHRVKNNLAVISGLIQLQTVKSIDKEVSKALTDSQLRIQSIALVHEKLYGSDSLLSINYEPYLKDLVNTIQETYVSEGKDIYVVFDVESISLNINQAIPCSLLINEVIVNAHKHAFEDQETGEIKISVSEADKKIKVIIEDDGKGFSENSVEDQESLGFTLITTLTSQLNGNSSFQNREKEKGTRFVVEFERKS